MEFNRLLEIAHGRETCDFCEDCGNDTVCVKCEKVNGVRADELRIYHTAVSTALRKAAEHEQLEREGRLVVLSIPMLPMVISENENDTDVYCPRCNHDLAGGWSEYDPDNEWKLCQCPRCGQSLDDCAIMTRAEALAATEGNRDGD